MASLLDNNELRGFLESLDYPIPDVRVLAAYELKDNNGFPIVVFSEIENIPRNIETTDDGGIQEGPSDIAYQIRVMARDCQTVDGEVVDRETACRLITQVVRKAMLDVYGLKCDDQSPCYPMDATCSSMVTAYVGVIDNYNYTYSR